MQCGGAGEDSTTLSACPTARSARQFAVRAPMALVTPMDAMTRRQRHGWVIVDVRARRDFFEFNIPGSINVPFDAAFLARLKCCCDVYDRIIVSCGDGALSGRAAVRMAAAGYRNVACLYRGITAWIACGLPFSARYVTNSKALL